MLFAVEELLVNANQRLGATIEVWLLATKLLDGCSHTMRWTAVTYL